MQQRHVGGGHVGDEARSPIAASPAARPCSGPPPRARQPRSRPRRQAPATPGRVRTRRHRPVTARATIPVTRRSSVEPCQSRAAFGEPMREDRPPASTIPAASSMGTIVRPGFSGAANFPSTSSTMSSEPGSGRRARVAREDAVGAMATVSISDKALADSSKQNPLRSSTAGRMRSTVCCSLTAAAAGRARSFLPAPAPRSRRCSHLAGRCVARSIAWRTQRVVSRTGDKNIVGQTTVPAALDDGLERLEQSRTSPSAGPDTVLSRSHDRAPRGRRQDQRTARARAGSEPRSRISRTLVADEAPVAVRVEHHPARGVAARRWRPSGARSSAGRIRARHLDQPGHARFVAAQAHDPRRAADPAQTAPTESCSASSGQPRVAQARGAGLRRPGREAHHLLRRRPVHRRTSSTWR